jgi:hypothetical protein
MPLCTLAYKIFTFAVEEKGWNDDQGKSDDSKPGEGAS